VRADRLISTLLLLQVHGRLTARDLAERLEISERTVLRDMDALTAAGVPVVAERGPGGGWRLIDGYQTKLTGLTAAEIQTLFFAHPPQLLAALGLGPAAQAARLKLQAALPAASRQQAERARRSTLIDPRGWHESQSVASLPVLLDALWRGRRVRFLYDRALGDTSERLVDPLGLVARGSVWYLVASRSDELRTYRVSRIKEAMLDEQESLRPDDFDLAAYWETSTAQFRERLPRYCATFLVGPAVTRWARYRGWRLEEQHEEGDRVRIRIRFDAEEEALQFALSFAGDAEVIEPADLRDKVLEAARGTIERYASAAPAVDGDSAG
jgi:predicted DNA-binding transcriptional regulator YafY